MLTRCPSAHRRLDGSEPRFTVLDDYGVMLRVKAHVRSLDVRVAPRWNPELVRLASGGRHVAIDMSDVTLVDSAGLGAIVAATAAVRSVGGDVSLFACAPDVRDMLRLVHLHQLIDIDDTADTLPSAAGDPV